MDASVHRCCGRGCWQDGVYIDRNWCRVAGITCRIRHNGAILVAAISQCSLGGAGIGPNGAVINLISRSAARLISTYAKSEAVIIAEVIGAADAIVAVVGKYKSN